MTFDDFRSLCEQRRSIRYFADEPLSRDELLRLLDVAHLAPSVHNLQPWTFHVIGNADLKKKLMESSCYGNFVTGAGAFVIVTCDTAAEAPAQDPVWNPRELEYSCMAAMTQILLGATAMNLGACWVSLHHGSAHETLGLPRTELIVGGLMIGRLKKGEAKASAEHQRKPVDAVVEFHD